MTNKKLTRADRPFRTGLLMLSIVLVFMAVLAGCGDGKTKEQPKEQPNIERESRVSETKQGDFIYRLVIEQPPEGTGGKPELWAELEYAGDKDDVTIFHAASPFFFFLKETTRGYDVGYMMDQPLIGTKLKRGAPLKERYDGGGGYTGKESQAYIDFLNDLNKNGFPIGRYEASGCADFYTEAGGKKQDYKIEGKLTFTVD